MTCHFALACSHCILLCYTYCGNFRREFSHHPLRKMISLAYDNIVRKWTQRYRD